MSEALKQFPLIETDGQELPGHRFLEAFSVCPPGQNRDGQYYSELYFAQVSLAGEHADGNVKRIAVFYGPGLNAERIYGYLREEEGS